MKPFGTVSQHKALPEDVKAMSISIAHPETVDPQTVVTMPKVYARKQAPLVHVINQNKFPVMTRSTMPINNPVAPVSLVTSNQQAHVFDKKLPSFVRPQKVQPMNVGTVPLMQQNATQSILMSQPLDPIHQIQRTTHSFIRAKPQQIQLQPPVSPTKMQPIVNNQPMLIAQPQPMIVQYQKQAVIIDQQGQNIDQQPHIRHQRVYSPQQIVIQPQQIQRQMPMQPQPIIVQEVFRTQHHRLQQSVYSKQSQPQLGSMVAHKRIYNAPRQIQPVIPVPLARVQPRQNVLEGKQIIQIEPIQPLLLAPEPVQPTMPVLKQPEPQPMFAQPENVDYQQIQIVEFEPIPPLII